MILFNPNDILIITNEQKIHLYILLLVCVKNIAN